MELDLLDAFINPRSQTLVPLVVAGAAGVGKTALLVEFAAYFSQVLRLPTLVVVPTVEPPGG